MNFFLALKYRAMVMAVVVFVEHTLPDDFPGTKKLDIALKALIKMDAKISKLIPEVTTLIAGAKDVYNSAKAVEPAETPAA